MNSRQLQHWQRLIVLAHALLALCYGILIPPFEAHDETGHFSYVQYVLATGTLPSPRTTDKAFLDQSHQPPAYYLLTAAAVGLIDRGDFAQPERNTFAFDGSNRNGVRILVRQPGENFPWHGSALAVHIGRMVSAALSAIMLLAIAATARHVFAGRPWAALLATALAAFNPQVLFMAAMINNDIMVSLCGALIALSLSHIAAAPKPQARALLGLGLSLGLSLASKNSALILIPFCAGALAFIAWRNTWTWPASLRRATLVAIATAATAGPHFLRNRLSEGKWLLDRIDTTLDKLVAPGVFGEGLSQGLTDAWLPRIFVNAFRTFWGTFGWGNVQQPDFAYTLIALLSGLALIGVLAGWRGTQRLERTQLTLALALASVMFLLPTYRAISFQDPALLPGRYLMPGLSGIVCLMAFGLQHVFQKRTLLMRSSIVVLALWAALTPLVFIAPRYAAQLAARSNAAALLRFGDIAELTRVEARVLTLPDTEGPRHYARVQLTWRALRATGVPYASAVTVLGSDAEPLGSSIAYSQRGNYPSTIWSHGAEFTDEFDILLQKPCARLPALGRISVALFVPQTDRETGAVRASGTLSVTDAAGALVTPIVGRFKIDAPKQPYPIHWLEPQARFDGALGLRDISVPSTTLPGSTLTVRANYELLTALNRDATVFVHALDQDGNLVAQDDHAPFGGDYPLTLWDAGDCARETFHLAIPETAQGELSIVTGWYDSAGRLRATGPLSLKNDLAKLGATRIVR